MTTPKISIVITTHGSAEDLPIMVGCLDQQYVNRAVPHSRTGVPVKYGRGARSEHSREIIVVSDGSYGGPITLTGSTRNNIQILETEKQGGVGHHTREPGIKAAKGEFVVLTNSDNYFMAGWLDRVASHISADVGMVVWDCVNNLWKWGTQRSEFERGKIDLACVAVRASIAKQVGFPYKEYDGDFDYINQCRTICRERNYRIPMIREILSVHN